MRTRILVSIISALTVFGAAGTGACKKAADEPGGTAGGTTNSGSGTSPSEATLKSITASSSLEKGGKTHGVANLMDGGNAYWCEGKANNGLGESFTLTFDESVTLSTFRVRNGTGDPKLYAASNRIKKLLVNGVKVKLKDEAGFQTVNLPTPVTAESIKFVIGSVHQGAKYRDTCLNEIAIEGVKAPAAGKPVDEPTNKGDVTDPKDPSKTDPKKKDPVAPPPGKDLPPPPGE